MYHPRRLMDLLNGTAMVAKYTLGVDPDGRQRLVVVIKGTFQIPGAGSQPALAAEQVPFVDADVYAGEPGTTAVVVESDFAAHKPRCDVVVHGAAHAPNGRAVPRVNVGLRVGASFKEFECIGDREWIHGSLGVVPSVPRPFFRLPIAYDRAYGGVDCDPRDPSKVDVYMDNPVGVGHYPHTRGARLVGKPLPNTAELGHPIGAPVGRYRPMAFGVVGRMFAARARHAGTYDQAWFDERFPFLPADYSPLYNQCAPADQQIDHPIGGERVELINLAPGGRQVFNLPSIRVPVEFTCQRGPREEVFAVLDTIVLEPELGRFSLTWRASRPLRRDVFEVAQAVVGRMPPAWYRARQLGKTYYPSLSALSRAVKERA